MEFCMAILLLEGRAGLNEFTDEVVLREDVQRMIERIDFVVDDEAERAGYHKMTTMIDIELTDGRRISGRADFGKGSPVDPMSYDEVAEKFRECVEFARFPRSRAETVVGMVRDLETLPSIDRLMAALRRPA
jgi:2-methylcitrate dehydratase PrpD